jgi:hypothetical protein
LGLRIVTTRVSFTRGRCFGILDATEKLVSTAWTGTFSEALPLEKLCTKCDHTMEYTIILQIGYGFSRPDRGIQLVDRRSRTVKVICRIVTGVNAHAHARDVDRVPAYVCLEGHCRGRRWMGERRFRRVVGAKELSEVGVLLADQAGDNIQHERGTDRAFEFQELQL